jgi:HEAT repeat protein
MKKLLSCCVVMLLLAGCEQADPEEAENYVHGDRTIRDWLEMVRDEDEDVVWDAFAGLDNIGPEAKEAVPAFVKALDKDENATVRMLAARCLGKIEFDNDQVRNSLTRAMADKNRFVQRDAMRASGKIARATAKKLLPPKESDKKSEEAQQQPAEQ